MAKFPWKSIHVIGCGGIGSWLIPPLACYAASFKFDGELRLWDGDKYEAKNQVRQDFYAKDIAVNKAVAKAEEVRLKVPQLNVIPMAEFVTGENVAMAMPEKGICFACVDNHPCRRILDEQLMRNQDGILISAGNEKIDGNACVHIRQDGIDVTESVISRHPEIAESKEGDRSAGCEALISAGQVQLLVTNFNAATACLNDFFRIVEKGKRFGRYMITENPQEAYFNICEDQTMSIVPAFRKEAADAVQRTVVDDKLVSAKS